MHSPQNTAWSRYHLSTKLSASEQSFYSLLSHTHTPAYKIIVEHSREANKEFVKWPSVGLSSSLLLYSTPPPSPALPLLFLSPATVSRSHPDFILTSAPSSHSLSLLRPPSLFAFRPGEQMELNLKGWRGVMVGFEQSLT